MFDLGPKQSRSVIIVAILLYAAVMAGLFAWLAFNGEETVQERVAQTPSVTVTLAGKEPLVPDSWKEKPAKKEETPVAVPATEKPAEQSVPPEAQQTPAPEQKPAEAAKPEEAKPAEQKPVEQKPVEQTPAAEQTPPVTETPTAEQQQAAPQPEATAAPVQAAPALRWQRFARPFDQTNPKPRISIIISDLGLAAAATQAAVQEMPGEISLAFSSAAPDLEAWIAKARAAGHEAILTVPMEPEGYPKNDPGPNTLLTGLDDKENISRVRWALARSDGYVGVMPYMGAKFTTVEDKMAPILDVIKEQGLMIVDDMQNTNSVIPTMSRLAKIPFVRSDTVIDLAASRTAIELQLEQLEKAAIERGHAIGVALPYPVTFEKLKAWLPTLEQKGIVLAPVTALVAVDAPVAAPATAPVAETPAVVDPNAPAAASATPVATPTPPATPAEPDPNRVNNELVQ